LRQISQRAPRFLFRAWSNLSGGDAKLNSKLAITPLAFHAGLGQCSIHDVPRPLLAKLAATHIAGSVMKTVFSSWTQHIATAMLRAADWDVEDPYD